MKSTLLILAITFSGIAIGYVLPRPIPNGLWLATTYPVVMIRASTVGPDNNAIDDWAIQAYNSMPSCEADIERHAGFAAGCFPFKVIHETPKHTPDAPAIQEGRHGS